METTEHSAMNRHITRSPIFVGRRFGFGALLLALLMLVCGAVHAEPTAASIYLQRSKFDFQLLQVNVQMGRNAALAGKTAQARSFFTAAKVQSIIMSNDTTSLYFQNADTLSRGLYRNRAYQEAAVFDSNVLNQQVRLLDAYLSLLVQTPSSTSVYFSAYAGILNVMTKLQQTEQAMIQAQL